MIGRWLWNVLGAAGLSVVVLFGAYWFVELVTPLMEGKAGLPGAVLLVVLLVAVFVGLFLVLLRLAPWWVETGEKRFR